MRWLQFAASVTHLGQAFGTSLHEPVMGNFTRSLYSLSVLGIPIFLSTAVAAAAAGAAGATILYHNNGDWRTHAQTPSAILVNQRASYDEAVGICASYNETLLHCDQLGAFVDEIVYQIWLGNINEWDLLWTSCGRNQPADTKGNMHQSAGKENWEFFKFPFLCTNSAPFVDKVDTDYSTFPRVKTPEVDGVVFEGLRDHMAYRFLGIPFAKPPVGDLRFQYAQPVEYGNQKGAIVDATKYRQACMQVGSLEGNSQGLNPWGNSEDCLHLQVFTPVLPTQEASNGSNLKPVMLWIHGGAMINGAGSDSTFDGDSLVSRGDVVLVSINYRLNIFGLLTLDDGVVNGNYGLSDKIAALQWVKKYIRAFGGDPDNVTIFGQSAGGASVMDLIASPKAKGLFKNAIAQSLVGNVVNQSVIADVMLPYINPVCPPSAGAEARLQCLRQLPAATLLNISTEYWSWSTVIDGIYMTAQPLSLVANSQVNGVNILMGFMPDEAQSLLATSIAPNMSSLTTGFDALVSGGVINSSQIPQITASGLWDVPQQYTNDYNATVNIGTDGMVICHVSQFIKAASSTPSSSSSVSAKPFQSLWVYTHHRAYALSFYSFYDLCTFPVGEPDVPYYRCHSGDLYETFGTYYLFNQPVRVDEDIYYTNAVQDIWTSFARSDNPNPDKKYLEVRDYQSSLRMFEGFGFEEYTSKGSGSGSVANLQWPRPWLSDLRDQTHCQVLGMT